MSKMIVPVNNWSGKIGTGQNYGWRQLNGATVYHRGIDMGRSAGVNSGDPIYAAADGVVTEAGYGSGTGNYCIIEHNFNGTKVYTYYAHMISSPKVSKGQKVSQSQEIGKVGNSGDSYGAHLHFEIQVGSFSFTGYSKNAGNSVNPLEGWISVGQDQKKHPNGGYGGGSVPGGGNRAVTAATINTILSGHMSGKGDMVIKAAQKYDVDAALMAAVIMQETGGTSNALVNKNNPGGIMDWDNNWKTVRHFATLQDGLDMTAKTIKKNIDAGGTTLEKLRQSYAPDNAANDPTGKNKNWTPGVKKFLDKMGVKESDVFKGFGGGTVGTGSVDWSKLDLSSTSDEIGKQLAHTNQPSRINGVSPNPTKDNYPKHRYMRNPFVLRIGDSQFYIPPINIQHHKVGASYSVPTMRNRTSMLKKSGWTEGTLMISLMFADIDQINGYKVEAPDDTHYHMDGVRSLLAQFHKNPMLPIRNEYINNGLGIYNVIIEDIQIATVPELPNVLNVTVVARECATKPYTGTAEFAYDMCFNYPMWRWFYQNLLVDEESKRLESVYLRPIEGHMRNTFLVRTIDDAQVAAMQEDLTNEANITIKDYEDNGKTIDSDQDAVSQLNPQYLLGRFSGINIRSLMSEWDLGAIHVEAIQGSISKQLSRVNMMEYEAPVFQDMGGINKIFDVQLKLTSREQVNQLQTLVRIVEETAREYRHMFVGGFIEIHNDIINMCGVDFCMIEEVTCSTSPVNGVFDATIRLREYNPSQSNHESLQGIKTDIHRVTDEWVKNNGELAERQYTAAKNDRFNTVNEEYLIETLIKQLELYPDLRLPSLVDANRILKKINDWRAEKGYELIPFDAFPSKEGDMWVEPDFYFMYPTPDDVYASIGMTEFGTKMEALFATGEYDGFIEDSTVGTTTPWYKMASAAGLHELVTSFTGREASNNFNLESADRRELLETGKEFVYPNQPVYTDFFKEWHSDMPMPEPGILASLMLYDQVNYDQRYRLNRFFPTYMMLFVDEGQWIDGRRLWNTHYAYHAIHEMTITKDKNNPIDTAYIRLSNMYGTFNSDSKLKEPKDYFKYNPTADGVVEYVKDLYDAWHFTAKDLMVDARKMMEHASLEVGARIHLRMGNSSNTANLPTVFNGQITSVNDGVDIEIFAQGDGVELASGPISGNKGDSTPSEPHNALQKYLTKRESNYLFTVSSDLEFSENFYSLYGIEHFGWVQSKDGSDTGLMEWIDAVFSEPEEMKQETSSYGTMRGIAKWVQDKFDWLVKAIGATFDNFESIYAAHEDYIVGVFSGNPSFLVYDVMKNIFRGRTDLASTGILFGDSSPNTEAIGGGTPWESFLFKDGERNITLTEMNKTVWDIGTTLSLFVPEFIFGVHHHGLRSTAFFGMPHWLVKFRYHKPKGVKNNLTEWKEEVKPFQQAHIINTQVDLIHNGIRASAELLRHEQTALYSMGDASNTKEGVTVYADKSILSDQRKRDVVDTGVLQDIFGPDSLINGMMTIVTGIAHLVTDGLAWGVDQASDFLNFFGIKNNLDIKEHMNVAQDFLSYISRMGEMQALDVAVGNMQRNFMEMYQGEVVILGQGSIKPWDIFYMDDTRKMMSGTAQVGQVTHTLSRATGFMSVIKPDLIVTRVEQHGRRNEALKTAMQICTFGGLTALRLTSRINGLDWLASGTYKKIKYLGIKTGQFVDNTSTRFGGIRVFDALRDYIDDRTNVDNDKNKPKDVDGPDGRMKKLFDGGMKALKRNLITMAIAGTAEELFGRWWDKKTKHNNVIYIHPLMKAGVPFTAGVKGALHIIPNYIDRRYFDDEIANPENNDSGSGDYDIRTFRSGSTQKMTMINKNKHLESAQSVKEPSIDATVINTLSAQDDSVVYAGSNQVSSVSVATYIEFDGSSWDGANTTEFETYAKAGAIVHPAMDLTQVSVKHHYAPTVEPGTQYGTVFAYNALAVNKGVRSIAKGKVVYSQTVAGKGHTVVIEHASAETGNTYYSGYYGLKNVKVKRGDFIKKGEKIGDAGGLEGLQKNIFEFQIHITTYTADDEKHYNGSRVNPVDFLKKAGIKIS